MKIPVFPKFKKIEISDRHEVELYVRKYPPYSDYNFTSLWSWDTEEQISISRYGNHLIVRFTDYVTGKEFYSILGTEQVNEVLHLVFEHCRVENFPQEVRLIPESVIRGTLEPIKAEFYTVEDWDNHDYILSVEDTVKLEGSHHGSNRYFIRFFERRHPTAEVRDLNITAPVIREQILKLITSWAGQKGITKEEYEHELKAIKRHITYAEEFPGLIHFVGLYEFNKLLGFASYEILNREFALTHFLKAMLEFKGIYQFMWYSIAKRLQIVGIKYLNIEQDLGIKELHKAKSSLRPATYLKKFIIKPRVLTGGKIRRVLYYIYYYLIYDMLRDLVKMVRNSWSIQAAVVYTLLLSIWWFTMMGRGITAGTEPDIFTSIYGLMSLWGGVLGLITARGWGSFRSVFGRALSFISLGLLAQFFGQVCYAVYIYILGVEVPYPSFGDIGYFGSVILYMIGIAHLFRVVCPRGEHISAKYKFFSIILPLILLGGSYLVFLRDYDFSASGGLVTALDFGYPLGQAIYVSLAILVVFLSRSVLGGIMRQPMLLLLFSFIFQYFCDFIFLYQVQHELWHVGGINDYMYFVSYFLMTLSLGFIGMRLKTLRAS